MSAAELTTALPLCSLSFEYSLGCSPNRRDEPRDLLRGPTTILIAGNRTQFSRTEGKDFPSERVAVFSLSRLCCQRLCETFFSPRFPLRAGSSAATSLRKFEASGVRSGSRYLVSVVFAVKDFVKLSSAAPGSDFLRGLALLPLSGVERLGDRRGPNREAVYAPGRGPSASAFVAIVHFPKKPAISKASDRERLDFCAVICWPVGV